MTTLTFDTPTRRRDPRPVEVDFCGEHLTLYQPKDAVLYFAQTISGDTVSDADRAMAVLQFLDGTLDAGDRKRYMDRARDADDPVDMDTTGQLVTGLLDRWSNWPDNGQPDPVVVEPGPQRDRGETITVNHTGMDLELTAHPPKDIIQLFAVASLAATATLGQQAWAMGLFLDASLDPADSLWVSRRMRDPGDDLDLDHVAEMVTGLLEQWRPAPANRAQRRAAARQQQSG